MAKEECRHLEVYNDKAAPQAKSTPAKALPPNAVRYSNRKSLHTYNQLPISFCLVCGTELEATHDTNPDKCVSLGGPSLVGVTSKVASTPTVVDCTPVMVKKRPGHRHAPKPNAWFGKASVPRESQHSG